jgi:hypothetical protein
MPVTLDFIINKILDNNFEYDESTAKEIIENLKEIQKVSGKKITDEEIKNYIKDIYQNRKKRREFDQDLIRKGFIINIIDADGNCLFRAISFIVYGDENHYKIIRAATVEYLKKHRDLIDVGDKDKYLLEKAKDRVWGDEPCIRALCAIYGQIFVYKAKKYEDPVTSFVSGEECKKENERLFTQIYDDVSPEIKKKINVIFLSNYSEGHFNALTVDGGKPFRTPYLDKKHPGKYEQSIIPSLSLQQGAAACEGGACKPGAASKPKIYIYTSLDNDNLNLFLTTECKAISIKDFDPEKQTLNLAQLLQAHNLNILNPPFCIIIETKKDDINILVTKEQLDLNVYEEKGGMVGKALHDMVSFIEEKFAFKSKKSASRKKSASKKKSLSRKKKM